VATPVEPNLLAAVAGRAVAGHRLWWCCNMPLDVKPVCGRIDSVRTRPCAAIGGGELIHIADCQLSGCNYCTFCSAYYYSGSAVVFLFISRSPFRPFG